MALAVEDLFAADPEAAATPKGSFNEGISATMHGGYYDAAAKRPVALQQWLFKAGEPTNADALAQLFGGTPVEDAESTKEFFISVFGDSASVSGVLTADDVSADMKLWVNGKLTHHCTGTKFISHPFDESQIGAPCGCPTDMDERKARAKAGMGPSPSIDIEFVLADDVDFRVRYHTGSWSLLRFLPAIVRKLAAQGESLATFELEQIETKAGRKFTVPKVNVGKAWNDAVAA